MNVFTCEEEISELAVYSSKKYRSFQSTANLSIYQNIFKDFSLKIAPSKNKLQIFLKNIGHSKNTFSKFFLKKFLSQKIHFQNWSLKKYIFEIAFLKKLTSYL